jgi:hypothetical protein
MMGDIQGQDGKYLHLLQGRHAAKKRRPLGSFEVLEKREAQSTKCLGRYLTAAGPADRFKTQIKFWIRRF